MMPGAPSWESLFNLPGGTTTTRVVRFGNAGNGLTITMSSGAPQGGMVDGPMAMGGNDLHSLLQHIRVMLEQSGYVLLASAYRSRFTQHVSGWPLATWSKGPTAKP